MVGISLAKKVVGKAKRGKEADEVYWKSRNSPRGVASRPAN